MYRNATQEEIRRIKGGDYFLVRDYYNPEKVYEFQAAHNSSCTNCKWYVAVNAMCLDARTGHLINEGIASFGEGRIVIEE